MVEYNSIETPKVNPNKNDQQQCRLNRTNKIKGYFVAEIEERKLMSERHGKYIASFDYFDKLLIVLSTKTGSISTASFATVIGTPVSIGSASFKSYIFLQKM